MSAEFYSACTEVIAKSEQKECASVRVYLLGADASVSFYHSTDIAWALSLPIQFHSHLPPQRGATLQTDKDVQDADETEKQAAAAERADTDESSSRSSSSEEEELFHKGNAL